MPASPRTAIITCPHCHHQQREPMPEDACLYFYECPHCKNLLRPKQGDCCVFCSYGNSKCPPFLHNQCFCSNPPGNEAHPG